MKLKFTLFSLAALFASFTSSAQTADEIINTYFENIGGADNWRAITGIKQQATLNQGGMEIPLTILQLADGRQMVNFEIQGKKLSQGVFDGEIAWGHNMMNMEAEKSDNEATENLKRELKSFPDPFLDYKKKGFSIELLGKETVEGAECFKIKLTKQTQLVDGEEVDNISYYFFETENFVPIVIESEIKSGQMKGNIRILTFSDYQEVNGLYFPFSFSDGFKGMGSQTFNISSVELNPTVDDSIFKFPASSETKEEGN